MSSQMILRNGIAIFFTIVLIAHCSEDKKPADIAPNLKELPEFAGQWNVQGIETEHGNKTSFALYLDPEKKMAMLGQETFELEMDSIGLRVKSTDKEHAVGYFLFSEIKEHTWVGTWDDRVIRLLR